LRTLKLRSDYDTTNQEDAWRLLIEETFLETFFDVGDHTKFYFAVDNETYVGLWVYKSGAAAGYIDENARISLRDGIGFDHEIEEAFYPPGTFDPNVDVVTIRLRTSFSR
jgi:hypothetical protein